MPIQDIDGYLGSTMQGIFTFVGGYARMQAWLNIVGQYWKQSLGQYWKFPRFIKF